MAHKVRCCAVCKTEITPERLDALPETRLCTEHGAEIEAYGGEFRITAEQERTSKQGSLKINYGGVTTKRTRNDDAVERLKDDYHSRSV